MNEAPRKRGRPKGTGLNDTATLAAIARLRASDPDLKPTTAIRKLGITDPSVVRRLRDKLKGDQDLSVAPPKTAPDQPSRVPSSSARAPLKRRGVPARPGPATVAGPLQANVTTNLPPREASSPEPRLPPEPIQPSVTPSNDASPPRTGPLKFEQPSQPESAQAQSSTRPEPHEKQAEAQPEQRKEETAQGQSGIPDPQVEAMRLSAEAAAAVSRLYLHCLTHAASMSPMAMALRAQNVSSQWLAMFLAQQSIFTPPRRP